MRQAYNQQINELADLLGEVASKSGKAMEKATLALLNADISSAEQVITEYEEIKELSAIAEERAFAFLALQAPVAGDLRSVVSAIQIVADIDRMGALSLHIAKIARRRHPHRALPEEIASYFSQMGSLAVKIGNTCEELLATKDEKQAIDLLEEDAAMESLHRHLFTLLLDEKWEHGVEAAVDVTLLGRFYGRYADHAAEVGRRVVFLVTGILPEYEEEDEKTDIAL